MALFDNPIDPGTQGLLAMASGLLSAGGASRVPITTGAALGQGMMGGLGAYNDAYKTNTLIGLEQQKAALTNMQVQQAVRQQAMAESLLKQYGLMPSGNQASDVSQGMPSQNTSPFPQNSTVPALSSPQTPSPVVPALSTQSPGALSPTRLPDYAGKAFALDAAMNGGKGMANVLTQALGPKEISGVGSVQYNPKTGQYEALPGLADAMAKWKQAQTGVENENTVVDVKLPTLPSGQTQQMTKKQQLEMLNPENAINLLSPQDRANIQADMAKNGITNANLNFQYPNGNVRGSVATQTPGITVGHNQDTEKYNQLRTEGFVKEAQNWEELGKTTRMQEGNIARLESLLNTPGVAQGKLADQISDIKNIGASLGIKTEGLGAEQAIKSITTEMAMRLRTSGGENLMPGQMSNYEDKLLRSIPPGLENTKEGRAFIFETMKGKLARDKTLSDMARQYEMRNGRLDLGFPDEAAKYVDAHPLFTSEPDFKNMANSYPIPPQVAINRLKMNPKEKAQFEEIFGPSDKYLKR